MEKATMEIGLTKPVVDLTLTDEELQEKYIDVSAAELNSRKMVAEMISKEANNNHDPRWERVSNQGRLLDMEIVRREKQYRKLMGLPEPPAQVVQMGTAKAKAVRHQLGTVQSVAGKILAEHFGKPSRLSAIDLGLLKTLNNKEKDNG